MVVSSTRLFPYWYLALAAGGCFLGFGVWGIADRELSERGATATARTRGILRATKVLATVVGAASAAALAVMVMAFLIGRVIS